MKKKLIAGTLGVTMIAGMITGCGGGSGESSDGNNNDQYATYSAGPDHLEDMDAMNCGI